MATTTFRGVIETAFENFVCLRGFAPFGELVDISEADASYQRPLLDGRKNELGDYLERGEFLFFPEVVLAINFDGEQNLNEIKEFFQLSTTTPKSFSTDSGQATLKISSRYYASTKERRVRDRLVDGSLVIKEGAKKFHRIDGNHRLSAATTEKARRYRVPFCIVLFGDEDQTQQFARAVFHTINFKQQPMAMEHNLKLILDNTEENLRLFPTDKLVADPSFGHDYVRARNLLPKINLEYCDALSNVLRKGKPGEPEEFHRTFALAIAKLFEQKKVKDADWVANVFTALKHVNGVYATYPSLKDSTNRGLLAAFTYLAMDAEPAARSNLVRFTNWVVRGQLAELSETEPHALLGIFEKLQTAKSRQIFVAMAFRDETKPTFQAIQDAIDDVNREHHLGLLPLKPIRIDEFDSWRSYKITDAIMQQIDECGLLVADLTYGNANVYHEIGYLFGLNTNQQRQLTANCILIWHKGRKALKDESADKIEANDVRFDLKDWSAIRFEEPNALRKSLAQALVAHYLP